MNPPPPAIHIIGQLGPSGCPPHPSSLPLKRPSTYLARSWGLLGEAVSSSASWLESLTIGTSPHLLVPCPVPPPSELCKSRLAGGSRPYRPLAPRGGPERQFSFQSANSLQVDNPTSTIEKPSLQPHCKWPQTPGRSIKSVLPDDRVGKPPCLEGLLRTSEGLPTVSEPLLASLGRDRLPCSLVHLCLSGCPEYGCPRLFSFQSAGFLYPLHCICYVLPTVSPQL